MSNHENREDGADPVRENAHPAEEPSYVGQNGGWVAVSVVHLLPGGGEGFAASRVCCDTSYCADAREQDDAAEDPFVDAFSGACG